MPKWPDIPEEARAKPTTQHETPDIVGQPINGTTKTSRVDPNNGMSRSQPESLW
mgnify:CR=1 FL=1